MITKKKISSVGSLGNVMIDLEDFFKTKRPDKRIMLKIEYAYEKFSVAKEFNAIEHHVPKKYLRQNNVKRAIRKKVVKS